MDIRTLVVCMAVASACASLILVALHGLKFWAEGTRQWALGYGLIATGLAGLALRPYPPLFLTFVVANLATLAGHLFLLDGIRRFTGRPPLSWQYPAVLLPGVAVLTWFSFVTPSAQIRTAYLTVVMTAVSALMTRDLLVGRPHPRRSARSLTGLVTLLLTLHAAIRVVATAVVPPPADFFATPPAGALLLLAYMGFIILVPAGLILMVSEKLQGDVKVLSDLLPICSYCRKIRDDRGYWNEIESYVRDHAGTQFSHGICPTCYEQQFKDLEDGASEPPAARQ